MKHERYVLLDDGVTISGNSVGFIGREGYTHDLRKAKIFTNEEIIGELQKQNPVREAVKKPFRYSDLLKIVQHHVSVKSLPKFQKGALPNDDYVLIDTRQKCGNSAFFWCNDRSGYTVDLRMAARYTEAQATDTKCRETDKIFLYEPLLVKVEHHVDVQDLRADDMRAFSHTFSHLKVDAPRADS